MLLLVFTAAAADLSWTCNPIATPADAHPYMFASVDGGQEVLDEVLAWVDCTTTTCAEISTDSVLCEEAACTTAAGAWVEYRYEEVHYNDGIMEFEEATTTVHVEPADADWSSADATFTSYRGGSGSTDGRSERWDVAWVGMLRADWPVDGYVYALDSSSSGYISSDSWAWSDPACTWTANTNSDASMVTVNGTDVEVYVSMACDGYDLFAYIDGAVVGPVGAGWLPNGADADLDGWGDEDECDDTNPGANPCMTEIACDGVDQDCDGADEGECDTGADTGADTGVDTGVDIDTADPDDTATDTDTDTVDTDTVDTDTVDTDTATVDTDTAPADTAAADTDPSGPSAPETGCGGGAALFLFVPLLARGARSPRARRGSHSR
ncbi:MAG: putative metal-binding motif-containing protein [Myxococcota bacterium]